MSSIANRSSGGLKLLGTVSGDSTKSANYFDSIGVNDYEFVYISVKCVNNSSGADYRGTGLFLSDSFSADITNGSVNFVIPISSSLYCSIIHRKSDNNWHFGSASQSTTTYSIYGVTI